MTERRKPPKKKKAQDAIVEQELVFDGDMRVEEPIDVPMVVDPDDVVDEVSAESLADEVVAHEDMDGVTEQPHDDSGKDAELIRMPMRSGLDTQQAHLKSILESLIFVSDKPLTVRMLAKLARTETKEASRLVHLLIEDYRGRGIELAEVAGGYQFRSAAENAPFVRELVAAKPVRLTRAQIETLAITAYRQPATRPEIDDIRGVDSGSALKVLLEKSLLKVIGRKEEAGRPLLYGTTSYFLEFFGLPSLSDLPTLREHSELSSESKALFQRRTGEAIEEIADFEIEDRVYTDEELASYADPEDVAAAPIAPTAQEDTDDSENDEKEERDDSEVAETAGKEVGEESRAEDDDEENDDEEDDDEEDDDEEDDDEEDDDE